MVALSAATLENELRPWPRRVVDRFTIRRHRRHHPVDVTVTLALDTAGFIASLEKTQESLRGLSEVHRAAARHAEFQRELELVRAEARWWIRGANRGYFVPADDLEEDRDAYVAAMAAQKYPPRLIVAFINGWIDTYGDHHPTPAPVGDDSPLYTELTLAALVDL